MVCNVITADKANRLFWLGRYVERIYISLHLLRRYYDKVLDGDISDLVEYYDCLGLTFHKDSDEMGFHTSQLYDLENIYSIASSINYAADNGIVLRRDITSESLSYIQMSQVIIKDCADKGEKNISVLQPITDYMLAFFGSIDERVFDERIRKFLKIGRLIENLDLHIRFNYPFYRIEEVFLTLKEHAKRDIAVINPIQIDYLDTLLSEDRYDVKDEEYKDLVLACLNGLVTV